MQRTPKTHAGVWVSVCAAVVALLASIVPASAENELRHEGQPRNASVPHAQAVRPLASGGGIVQTAPRVYLVQWNWNNHDPAGEAPVLRKFLRGVGGSAWNKTVTQYCEDVPAGTTDCSAYPSARRAGNPTGLLAGVWTDNVNAAPDQPAQWQLAAEAVRAARYFGNTSPVQNDNAQYVIATAHGKNAKGFGTNYCAWHSYKASDYGNIAYWNFPYIPDAGYSCGAGFINDPGTLDGVSVIAGHELSETITDPFPYGGWMDSNRRELADKCAWSPKSGNITLSTGTFPVQPLWSNETNTCVMSF